MNKKSEEDYIGFLIFACNECPDSLDLTYSLAYEYESEGNLNKAKEFYIKCLKLNPDCHHAKMKLGLLELT